MFVNARVCGGLSAHTCLSSPKKFKRENEYLVSFFHIVNNDVVGKSESNQKEPKKPDSENPFIK